MLAAPSLLAAASADDLRVGERLRRDWPADLVAAASEQAELRTRAAAKFSRAASMLLSRDGLEQSTGEVVARHRARRFAGAGGTVLDLCCGIGGDLAAIAAVVDGVVVGVDRDELHAICARHNARVYDADNATVAVADVTDIRVSGVGSVFVDPARRQDDRRGGSSPPLEWCFDLAVPRVCVKAAPGLDRDVVPPGWEAEFVADHRALKEAVLWSPGWATTAARATVLPGGDTLTSAAGTPVATVRDPGGFLLDPSPAVTRAGLVAELAAQLDAWQIDPQIAFLSADTPLRSPFGRGLVVEASLPFAVKPLTAELRRLDVGRVEIRRRGLAGDADLLKQRLRTDGSRVATVVLTRVVNRPWAFICTDLETA
ncbi:MAG TPA: class I SAM-dependent methyltransferase [Mycobacteriales bacterium]|nr:class I SAM-dependent methyltransferase [Mycobacteriales bacterium]